MALVLKILFSSGETDQRNYRTVKLDGALTVTEAVKQFAAKADVTNVEEYGFFLYDEGTDLEDEGAAKGRWLQSERTLASFGLTTSSLIELRKKTRLVKVELIGGVHKTLSTDDTWPVAEVVRRACSKFEIRGAEEFSLQVKGWREIDWLNGQQSLREQGVGEEEVVVLRKKFFTGDEDPDSASTATLQVLYAQVQRSIVHGTFPCGYDTSMQLAALQRVVDGTESDLDRCVPIAWRKNASVSDDIAKASARLPGGLTEAQAKKRYLSICMKLPTFGITLFSVKVRRNRFLGCKPVGQHVCVDVGASARQSKVYCAPYLGRNA